MPKIWNELLEYGCSSHERASRNFFKLQRMLIIHHQKRREEEMEKDTCFDLRTDKILSCMTIFVSGKASKGVRILSHSNLVCIRHRESEKKTNLTFGQSDRVKKSMVVQVCKCYIICITCECCAKSEAPNR
nr:hypothetical protein Iba_chr09fCG1140 [Ipomoea batatas]